MSLERFHRAQADPPTGFATALAELQRGRKFSHWIWYLFPQIAGLGRSATARAYELRDLAAACDYLRDPLLRARYESLTETVQAELARGVALPVLMGGATDALKVVSSLTLFRAAAAHLAGEDPALTPLAARCAAILEQTASAGYPPCTFTLGALASDVP